MSDNALPDLDPKTEPVFKTKGYELQKKISQGVFGQVYKAKNINTNELIAVKAIDLEIVKQKFKKSLPHRELTTLIGVKHENTCHILDIIKVNHKMYIFMEFCINGDISAYLRKYGAIHEEKTCLWFTHITEALKYLHLELHLAHRDIKVDNILLNDQMIAKLSDFMFVKKSWDEEKSEPLLSSTFCGSEPYYSPQIVAHKEYNPFRADMWAMGVVLYIMLNNKYPFHFGDQKRMLKEQMNNEFRASRFTKSFPKDLKELQLRLWDTNEWSRITASDVLQHKWIERKGK